MRFKRRLRRAALVAALAGALAGAASTGILAGTVPGIPADGAGQDSPFLPPAFRCSTSISTRTASAGSAARRGLIRSTAARVRQTGGGGNVDHARGASAERLEGQRLADPRRAEHAGLPGAGREHLLVHDARADDGLARDG